MSCMDTILTALSWYPIRVYIRTVPAILWFFPPSVSSYQSYAFAGKLSRYEVLPLNFHTLTYSSLKVSIVSVRAYNGGDKFQSITVRST